ncbi:MAG: hypothetical protein ACLSA6_16470 [Holdemania massiliensis]
MPDFEGILVASFSGRSDVYSGGFDGSFIPAGENRGRGFLRTPCNGSRDLIDPYFFTQGEAELCEVASYRYQRTDTLPAYQGQAFADHPQTFRLDQPFDGTMSAGRPSDHDSGQGSQRCRGYADRRTTQTRRKRWSAFDLKRQAQ